MDLRKWRGEKVARSKVIYRLRDDGLAVHRKIGGFHGVRRRFDVKQQTRVHDVE